MSDYVLIPAKRTASGWVIRSPEALKVTPVDPEVFSRIVSGDLFENSTCVTCGLHAAVFVCAGRFASLCPGCVSARIERYYTATGSLPPWVAILEEEARNEIEAQRRKTEGALEVSWDDLYRCGRCGRVVQASEAQYHFPPGKDASPPYCLACANALNAG